MVSTSARKAGDPRFDSPSWCNQVLSANIHFIYRYIADKKHFNCRLTGFM